MKAKFSLFILALSLLFFSCGGGLSQEGTGSVTMDAGKVARYLARDTRISLRDNANTNDDRGSGVDPSDYFSFAMTIKLSTIGDYAASAEEKYTISKEEMSKSKDAMGEFFYVSAGKPITIEDIPVGSRIKVKAELGFGQDFDEEGFKKAAKNAGWSDAKINGLLSDIGLASATIKGNVEGYSEEFTVKSGPNYVTVKMAGDDFGDFGEGYGEGYGEDYSFDIILYTNISGANGGNGLWSYTMNENGTSANYTKKSTIASTGFYDFVKGLTGNVFYVDESGYIYFQKSNATSPVQLNISNDLGHSFNVPKLLATDETGTILFYGATKKESGSGTLLRIQSWCGGISDAGFTDSMEFTSMDDTFGYPSSMSETVNIDGIYDFTVSLGTPSSSTDEVYGTTTISYNNAYLFIASKYFARDEWDQSSHNIFITRIPMIFQIEIGENTVESSISTVKEEERIQTIKLSELSINPGTSWWGDNYPYEITDMTVLDDKLYVLVSGKNIQYGNTESGNWYGSHFDNPTDPFDYQVYSNGAILRIDTNSFTSSNVDVF